MPDPVESDAQKSIFVGLHWPLKSSFLRYIANAPDGRRSVTDGAAWVDGRYFYFEEAPGSEMKTDLSGGLVKFQGDVRFSAHGGTLFIAIADPWVQIAGASGTLSISDAEGDGSRLLLLRLRIDSPLIACDRVSWNVRSASLTQEGATFFGGAYEEGTAFSPFSLSVATGTTSAGVKE